MVRDKPRLDAGLQPVGKIMQQMFAGMTASEALAYTAREVAWSVQRQRETAALLAEALRQQPQERDDWEETP